MGWPFKHWQLRLGEGQRVRVDLKTRANVVLLDEGNFKAYKAGRRFVGQGGPVHRSPALLRPAYPGAWHLCISHGDGAYRVTIINPEIWELARTTVPRDVEHVDISLRLPPMVMAFVKQAAQRHGMEPADLLMATLTSMAAQERTRAMVS